MIIASIVSIAAFSGLFGDYAQAYSALIALTLSFILSPLIAFITQGKYYIARPHHQHAQHLLHTDGTNSCTLCEKHYAQPEFAYCPFYDAPICSLCCTLETDCHDVCKPEKKEFIRHSIIDFLTLAFKNKISEDTRGRIANFIILSSLLLSITGVALWLTYTATSEQTTVNALASLRRSSCATWRAPYDLSGPP